MSGVERRHRADTTIVRVQRTQPHVAIPNATVRDPDLSLQAAGLLAYVLSLPDDWQLRGIRWVQQNRGGRWVRSGRDDRGRWEPGRARLGRERVAGAIRELRAEGYCLVSQARGPDGRMGPVTYTFRDVRGEPDPALMPRPRAPHPENPRPVHQPQRRLIRTKPEGKKESPQPPQRSRAAGAGMGDMAVLEALRAERQPPHVVEDLLAWFVAEGLGWWSQRRLPDTAAAARQLCADLAGASPRAIAEARRLLWDRQEYEGRRLMPEPQIIIDAVRAAERRLQPSWEAALDY